MNLREILFALSLIGQANRIVDRLSLETRSKGLQARIL